MSFTEKYGDDFPDFFADVPVEIQCETISGEASALIRDYVRKDDYGQAEIILIGAAVQFLKVGNEVIIKKANRAARRGGAGGVSVTLPNIFEDKEEWESLTDAILKYIVKHELWLAKKRPFDDAFAQYAPEDAGPDPT